mmetsp:Transcript_54829/g.138525  ORF Transcript_54829/g.138525 Transcript_54829/m.138525 type:complete len:239 (-) Transcript_54829:685-1401(-)
MLAGSNPAASAKCPTCTGSPRATASSATFTCRASGPGSTKKRNARPCSATTSFRIRRGGPSPDMVSRIWPLVPSACTRRNVTLSPSSSANWTSRRKPRPPPCTARCSAPAAASSMPGRSQARHACNHAAKPRRGTSAPTIFSLPPPEATVGNSVRNCRQTSRLNTWPKPRPWSEPSRPMEGGAPRAHKQAACGASAVRPGSTTSASELGNVLASDACATRRGGEWGSIWAWRKAKHRW